VPGFGNGRLPFATSATYSEAENGQSHLELRGRLSSYISRFTVAAETQSEVISHQTAQTQEIIRIGTQFGRIGLRGETIYNLTPTAELSATQLTADYAARQNLNLRLGVTRLQTQPQETQFTAGAAVLFARLAVGTDAIFACPGLAIDQSVSRFVPTFAYEFNDENAPELFLPPVSFPYGAAHASEIQYLFSLPSAAFPQALSAQQQQLAATMKGYWTNFAERGFPGSFGTPFWPLFNALTQTMESLVSAVPQTATDFARPPHCAFWPALEAPERVVAAVLAK